MIKARENVNRILLFLNRLSLFCHTALTVLLFALALYLALRIIGLTSFALPHLWLWVIACTISIPELIASVISNGLLQKHILPLAEMDTSQPKGEHIVKKKFSWMYSPDKLEQWLEEMKSRGYCLHSVGKRGRSFYFIKAGGQKKKYCVDYQLMANIPYYTNHVRAGWKPLFTTYGSFGKWTIWAKEYGQGQEPQLRKDSLHLLSHALRTALAYSSIFVPLAVVYFSGLIVAVNGIVNFGRYNLIDLTLIVFAPCLLAFASCTLRSWLYYQRLRNQTAQFANSKKTAAKL